MSEIIIDNISTNLYSIKNSDILLKEIINLLSKEKNIKFPKEYIINGYNFKIIFKNSLYYYITFYKNTYKILLNPLKIKFLINDAYQEYEIFNESKFSNLPKELNIKYPQIIYIKDNITYKTKYLFSSYINIYKETKNIFIISSAEIKMISHEDFNAFKLNDNCSFLDKSFDTPIDFDKNFYYYFPDAIRSNEKFHVISSPGRIEFINQIQLLECGAITKFFGANSIGKSITLIGTLKYYFMHNYFATLYINCKTMDFYSKEDPNICKQILIDEIIYLFYGDSETYYKAVSFIKNFDLVPNEEEKNFWSLVKGLFQFFKRNKIYFISFDQYGYNVDPFEQINDIYKVKNKMVETNCHLISLFTVSSLNDQAAQEYKAKILLNEEYDGEVLILLIEIKDIIEAENLKINDDEEIDGVLQYIGRNIANYNNINFLLKNKKQEINGYVEQKKKEIKEKLCSFFGIENNLNWDLSDKLNKFLAFSVNSKYSLEQFKKIYFNIPFEYFDAYKKKNNNQEYIKINYRYSIINHIFDELYSEVVLSSNINNILFNNVFDGGAKGQLFEKLVIHNFTPSQKNNFSVNFFGKFVISDIYSVDKYVPKKNEKVKNEKIDIIMVENKHFILKQTIFGGKAFDIVIVELLENQAIFFCFQITSYKKKKDLMELNQLKKNIETMTAYMKNYFNFEIISVFFSYIFDYSKLYETKVIKMCYNLDKRKIKYFFYDINTKLFYDKNNNNITEIKNNMNHFFLKEGNKIEMGKYTLNNNQTLEILKILKDIYKSEEISFIFFKSDDLNMKDLNENRLFCITKIKINDKDEIIMLYFENGQYKFSLLNKKGEATSLENYFSTLSFISNMFDYYNIIFE